MPRRLVLLVATTNAGKAREIAAALRGLPVRVRSLAEAGIRTEFEETGTTFAANARGKAAFYSRLAGSLTLAEDSGLAVDALKGRPGVLSARFSGTAATDARNNQKLLHLMRGRPESRRGARFICCMALARDGRVLKQVTGQVRGRILDRPRGSSGFGYDPVFFYRPLGRSFGELEPGEKNRVSHRGRALKKMFAYIKAHFADLF